MLQFGWQLHCINVVFVSAYVDNIHINLLHTIVRRTKHIIFQNKLQNNLILPVWTPLVFWEADNMHTEEKRYEGWCISLTASDFCTYQHDEDTTVSPIKLLWYVLESDIRECQANTHVMKASLHHLLWGCQMSIHSSWRVVRLASLPPHHRSSYAYYHLFVQLTML